MLLDGADREDDDLLLRDRLDDLGPGEELVAVLGPDGLAVDVGAHAYQSPTLPSA